MPTPEALSLNLFRPPTILIAEPGGTARSEICRMVVSLGYEARGVRDGRHAFRSVRQHPGLFRVVMAEVCLPYMDGGELAERVRDLEPGIRVVLTSDHPEGDAATLIAAYPELPLLRKPFTAPEVAAVLMSLAGPPRAIFAVPPTLRATRRSRDRGTVQ